MGGGAVVAQGTGGLSNRPTTKSPKLVLPGKTHASTGLLHWRERVTVLAGKGWRMARTWLVVSSTSSTFVDSNCTNGSLVVGSTALNDAAIPPAKRRLCVTADRFIRVVTRGARFSGSYSRTVVECLSSVCH